MLGFIILSYPLSLIVGFVLGALIPRPLGSILWSAAIGAALAAILSLEFLSMVGFQQLFLEMILPASSICAVLGIIGAGISIGVKAIVRRFGSRS